MQSKAEEITIIYHFFNSLVISIVINIRVSKHMQNIINQIEENYTHLSVDQIESMKNMSILDFHEIHTMIIKAIALREGKHHRQLEADGTHLVFFPKEKGNNLKNSTYQNVLSMHIQNLNQELMKKLSMTESSFKDKSNLPSSGAFKIEKLQDQLDLTDEDSNQLRKELIRIRKLSESLYRSFIGFILGKLSEINPSKSQLSIRNITTQDLRDDIYFFLNDMVLTQIKDFGTTKAKTIDLELAQTQTKIKNDINGNFLNRITESLYGSRNAGSRYISINTSLNIISSAKSSNQAEITKETEDLIDSIMSYQDHFSKESKTKMTVEYWNDTLLKITPYLSSKNNNQAKWFKTPEIISILESRLKATEADILEKYPHTSSMDINIGSDNEGSRSISDVIASDNQTPEEEADEDSKAKAMESALLANPKFTPSLVHLFLSSYSPSYIDSSTSMITDDLREDSKHVLKNVNTIPTKTGNSFTLSTTETNKFRNYLMGLNTNKKSKNQDQDK